MPSQESERSCICVKSIDFAYLFFFFWYFFFVFFLELSRQCGICDIFVWNWADSVVGWNWADSVVCLVGIEPTVWYFRLAFYCYVPKLFFVLQVHPLDGFYEGLNIWQFILLNLTVIVVHICLSLVL